MRRRKKEMKKIIPAAVAAILVLMISIIPAVAYFTTNATADGGYTVHLGDRTRITEEYDDWEKKLTVENTQGEAVFIRARGFAGSEYELSYSGSGWSDGGDGWWYYDGIVKAGEKTQELKIAIGGIPKEGEDGAKVNVAVVYESTPVQYETDGSTKADWTYELVSVTEGGNS